MKYLPKIKPGSYSNIKYEEVSKSKIEVKYIVINKHEEDPWGWVERKAEAAFNSKKEAIVYLSTKDYPYSYELIEVPVVDFRFKIVESK